VIIDTIILKDIFCFCGKQELVLPQGSDAITVILARNSGGKTSLIRAVRVLLYGYASQQDAELSVNRERLRRTKPKELVESSVECKFSVGSRRYTLRRGVQVLSTGTAERPAQYKQGSVLFVHEKLSDTRIEDPVVISARVAEFLPEPLFDFFFFKGEELANRLLERKSSDIRKGLEEVLYRDRWERVRTSLEGAARVFAKEAAEAQGRSVEFAKLSAIKDQIVAKEDGIKQALHALRSKEDRLRKEYESLDREYITAASGDAPSVRKVRDAKRDEAKSLSRHVETLERSLREEVGGSGGLYFLGPALGVAEAALERMCKDGLLPPDISQAFVERLLALGTCICGTDIASDANRRTAVERFRKRSVDEGLNNDLYALYAHIRAGLPGRQQSRGANVAGLAGRIDAELETLGKLEGEILAIEKQYDEKAEKAIHVKKHQRDSKSAELDAVTREIGKADEQLKRLSFDIEDNKREINRLGAEGQDEAQVPGGGKVVEQLSKLTDASEASLLRSFWKYLEEHTRGVYDEVVVDGSRAKIDSHTLMPSIVRGETAGYVAGGGQQQTLVLAYISALAMLRKRVNSDLRSLCLMEEVTEQCFLMDSVFAPMEPEYRRRVARVLPGKMPQLVLLLAPQQWDRDVETGLKGSINRVYAFHIRTNKVEGEDARTVEYKGKSVTLATVVKEPIEAYSTIEKVEG
jgi:DNA sulfur modification protein DndD